MEVAMRYIGKNISLISSSDVRYEGYLYTIDLEESTIALQDVNCMGTETRRTGNAAIGPSQTTYEFIIFRIENIKKLYLHDEDDFGRTDITKEICGILNYDSAHKPDGSKPREDLGTGISSESKRRVGRAEYERGFQHQSQTYDQSYKFNNQPISPNDAYYVQPRRPARGVPQMEQFSNAVYDQPRPYWNNAPQQGYYRGSRGNTYGRGAYYGNISGRQQQQQQQPVFNNYRRNFNGGRGTRYRRPNFRRGSYSTRPGNTGPQEQPGTGGFLESQLQGEEIEPPNQEFDFESANARFQKETPKTEEKPVQDATPLSSSQGKTENTEGKKETTTGQASTNETSLKYDKTKSFFDHLTTDTGIRPEQPKSNVTDQRKSFDSQTFGNVAEIYRPHQNQHRNTGNTQARTFDTNNSNRTTGNTMKWTPRNG